MKIYSVLGNSQRLDGGSMFGNVPRAMWERWVTPDEQHRIPLACRALLVKDLDGKTVLFETGVGAFFEPKMKERFGIVEQQHVLLESLAKLDVSHEDIDVVVLSHLHFDHAGGLLSAWEEGKEPELLFPNATIVVGRDNWERAQHPHPRDRASFTPAIVNALADSGRLEIIDGDSCEALGDAVRFGVSNGHTPGMLLAEIGGDGGVVFCADLVPGRPWVHLPVTMGYDRFPEKIIDEKQRFLADKLERGMRLFFTHDADCAMAELAKDEKGRYITVNERAEVLGEAA
jgi:glyoxylase-like metal-dependent hydrolase (beta-lactamase superfamily II)